MGKRWINVKQEMVVVHVCSHLPSGRAHLVA